MNPQKKRGLILSYSPIARDPRVQRQIDWLTSNNYAVTVVGLGDFKGNSLTTYLELRVPKLIRRVSLYLFATNKTRSGEILKSLTVEKISGQIRKGQFNFVLMNDLDFLGSEELFKSTDESGTPILLDLHEYFPDLGGGWLWKLLQGRYYNWLLKQLHERKFSTVYTVSEDIARLYETKLNTSVDFILNIPKKVKPKFINDKDAEAEQIKLVYHGAAGKGRGIVRLIRAVGLSKSNVDLTLILVASNLHLFVYKFWSMVYGKGKVYFHQPVPFPEISSLLSRYHAEVIFYHPPHSMNEFLSLPNKFFEALEAGLAIVTGPSPSMATLVAKYDLGVVVNSWSVLSLKASLDQLTLDKISLYKTAGKKALEDLSEKSQEAKFIARINNLVKNRIDAT